MKLGLEHSIYEKLKKKRVIALFVAGLDIC